MTDPRTLFLYAVFGTLWILALLAPPSAAERLEGCSPEPTSVSMEGSRLDD
jgi:hypothetical protein